MSTPRRTSPPLPEGTASGGSPSSPPPRWRQWLMVRLERLGHARRRGWPRVRRWLAGVGPRLRRSLGRSLGRSLRASPALLVALVLVLVLKSGPLGRSWVGSGKWGVVGAAVAERVLGGGWRLHLTVAALAGLSYLFGLTSPVGLLLIAPGLTVGGFLLARETYRHTPYARARARFGDEGWADFWELHRNVSAHAVRHIASHQRRSLAAALPAVPPRRRAGTVAVTAATLRRSALIERLPVTETGTWLGRSAVGPWWGVQTYAAYRDVVGLIAPPQTGKTALMIHHVIDHPGAVVSTSTKPEVYLYTAALRAAVSGAEHVALFNPDNLGGLGSTLRWCPVRGCADFRFATARAGLLVGARARKSDDEARWDEWASSVLTGLLMIADLDGRTMTDVARWVHNPTDRDRGAAQALRLMRETYRRQVPEEVADALGQVLASKAEKTRDSVFFAMRGAVAFMADPTIAWLCTPDRDEPMFDVEEFIDSRGALYLLGSEEQNAGSAPLLAAFTGHVFATAKSLAARRSGRLDPPLLISLDEAALITPVPLPKWVADAGGRGIHIVWSVQTPSQLRDTWGDNGADTILNATNALMIFGGLKTKRDLEEVSEWCGHRHELVPDPDGPDGQGRAKFERVPVCPPDRVRVIPHWHALLVHRATPATVVRIWPGWNRPDVRKAGPLPSSGLPVRQNPPPATATPSPPPEADDPDGTRAAPAPRTDRVQHPSDQNVHGGIHPDTATASDTDSRAEHGPSPTSIAPPRAAGAAGPAGPGAERASASDAAGLQQWLPSPRRQAGDTPAPAPTDAAPDAPSEAARGAGPGRVEPGRPTSTEQREDQRCR
ncbi:type IV secretory system conjugative DNA transfer family protein [Actinomycetospora soli]|uniref:type IV secretory system conjugative DNA transfer family protein n=1 Tax=Actinomycetospora soli TaxID=2893887 RepID=UPI001E3D816D|nr:TraM recognition domain-containing protein [Actinomycetospora soli]MCD2191222.1 TraM recognition domain-containing protein [Actinomycetospora soli]